MSTNTEIQFTPAGDRSDMVVVFNKQLDETRTMFEKQNATDFISLKDAAKTLHMKHDYVDNLERLINHNFFVLDVDKEAVNVILESYEALSLDSAKMEVRPKKVKPVDESEEEPTENPA